MNLRIERVRVPPCS